MSDEYAPQGSADASGDPESGTSDPPHADGEDILAAAGTGEAAGTDAQPDAAPADEGSAFLSELVRAMQTTAGAERARVAEDTDRRRDTHLATIQERREAESARIRELADDDLKAIDAWADEERQRIETERERRATALHADLEQRLTEHGARIDREIEGVEAAIAAYRADTDAFFTTLDRETDPVAIATQARRRPAFPDLGSIAAEPTAEPTGTAEAAEAAEATPGEPIAATNQAEATVTAPAADEDVGVAVMDRGFSPKLADAWATWSESPAKSAAGQAEPEAPAASEAPESEAPAAASGADAVRPEPVEVVAVTSSAVRNEPGGILQTVPVSRPMSWLRRGSNNDKPKQES